MCRRISPPKAERAVEGNSDPGQLGGVAQYRRVAKPSMSGLARPGNHSYTGKGKETTNPEGK